MANWYIFPFGKYAYERFESCNDLKYLTWFIGQLNNECQIKHCAEAIIKQVNKQQKERNKKTEEVA